MCDRLRWWDEYTEDTPVVVGHYWRAAIAGAPRESSGGKPDLFDGVAPDEWLGQRRNVFCVDFSVGARHRERRSSPPTFHSRLAALRWPEAEVVFDRGESPARLR
jgi:hypothetical protein